MPGVAWCPNIGGDAMANSFTGDSKKPANPSQWEPKPDANGGFLLTVPLPMIKERDEPAQSVDLQKIPAEQRLEVAMGVVDAHHPRIAKTLRNLWGSQECSDYLSKLIMSGGDGMGHARVGFHQDVADALLVLGSLHDTQFGLLPPRRGSGFDPETGFLDSKFNADWDNHR